MKQKGLSLLELMIVVAIVGILARIGVGLYFNQVQRANKSMAMQVLQQNIAKMENYYSQNGRYLESGNTWPGSIITSVVGVSGSPVYSVTFYPSSATSDNTQAYCLVATPTNLSSNQSDQITMYIDRYGSISTTAPTNCSISSSTNLVCPAGGSFLPCSGNCSNGVYSACSGNCDNITVCSGGTGCSGNCRNSVIYGGGCSGNCNNSIIYGGCSGHCSGSTCCTSGGNCTSC